MEREGKLKVKEEEKEEQEREISKLVLGLMEGYSDDVIPPLSQFQPWSSATKVVAAAEILEDSSSRRKHERPKPAKEEREKEESVGRERDRRLKMTESFALLESIVPGLLPKSTKEKVLHTTTEYIKYLEETKKMLERLKESRRQTAATSRNSSVTVTSCGSVAFFGIHSPKRQGFVTQIFMVFQNHRAEVLSANVVVNNGMLTLTVTAFVDGRGSSSEEIKRDILML